MIALLGGDLLLLAFVSVDQALLGVVLDLT